MMHIAFITLLSWFLWEVIIRLKKKDVSLQAKETIQQKLILKLSIFE